MAGWGGGVEEGYDINDFTKKHSLTTVKAKM